MHWQGLGLFRRLGYVCSFLTMAQQLASLAAICCFLAAVSIVNATDKPNIIFMLVDDLGYNSAWRNADHKTPVINSLLKEGVTVDRNYVYRYCAPTRGAFQTGRFPYHLSAVEKNLIPWNMPVGINLSYPMLPKMLKQAGYDAHHVGKWHQGFFTFDYTPVGRGYDSSVGFLVGGEDHFTQDASWTTKCKMHSVDLWNSTQPAFGRNGTYNGYTFTQRVVDLINGHDQSKPLFIYHALHNTHSPIEAPQRFVDLYDFEQAKRNTFYGMMSVVDESVANVTAALKRTGMWNNTLLVWTTDNGSPVTVAGSNAPLKGGKGSNWEGGTRTPMVVTGGYLPESMHGKNLEGPIHIIDWYQTFANMAGVDTSTLPAGPTPLESQDLWPYLTGVTDVSPRDEIIYDHRHTSDEWHVVLSQGPYKLVASLEAQAMWYGQFSPNGTAVYENYTQCSWEEPCLFDVVQDPTEHHDIAQEHPDVVQRLKQRAIELQSAYHAPPNPPSEAQMYCDHIEKEHGFVAPWYHT
eukprot:TRINITY_DN11768_c0_g1_i8.p1 TRINITY_DN11768_c0_g1~~TRINITY_DN11768_c0_g1_i8.p1  ORF type:complete len:519 (+),score=110.86 TRINITY_DN11768_c0_g1_i8:135-1691(+)